jgi:inner membrane transporter RhtA
MPAEDASDRRRSTVGALTQVGTEVSINFGSSLAGLAIPLVGAPLVVMARQLVMVVAVGPFYRPRRADLTWKRLWPAVLLGLDLAFMNLTFYEAVHLLGLGVAATIEFMGPLALAIATSRRILDLVCAVVAGAGVVILTGQDGHIDAWGVVLAVAAAVAWLLYILLTRRVALSLPGLEGLTVGSFVSLAVLIPVALIGFDADALNGHVVVLLLSIGVLSSALPYSLDTFILRRISTRLYATITSVGPAIAAAFGWLVLSERLDLIESLAIAMVCVAAGTAIATQRETPETDLERTASAMT